MYLTDERWEHIVDGHAEMKECEEWLRRTIQKGRRVQFPLDPGKFRYSLQLDGLPGATVYVVAIVLFRFHEEDGAVRPNNYIVTAFQKHLR